MAYACGYAFYLVPVHIHDHVVEGEAFAAVLGHEGIDIARGVRVPARVPDAVHILAGHGYAARYHAEVAEGSVEVIAVHKAVLVLYMRGVAQREPAVAEHFRAGVDEEVPAVLAQESVVEGHLAVYGVESSDAAAEVEVTLF